MSIIANKHKLDLNSYDGLFSDFDPRPTEQRALSDDFLLEVKRAARDKEIGLELVKAKTHTQKTGSAKVKEIKKMVARLLTINSQEGGLKNK